MRFNNPITLCSFTVQIAHAPLQHTFLLLVYFIFLHIITFFTCYFFFLYLLIQVSEDPLFLYFYWEFVFTGSQTKPTSQPTNFNTGCNHRMPDSILKFLELHQPGTLNYTSYIFFNLSFNIQETMPNIFCSEIKILAFREIGHSREDQQFVLGDLI